MVTTVQIEEIPPKLIMNWDQTRKLVPVSSYTMERQGSKRVEMGGAGDKRHNSGTILGYFLPCN